MKLVLSLGIVVSVLASSSSISPARADAAGGDAAAARADAARCHIGAYRMSDGSVIDVGATDGPDLRWRRLDGATGALHQAADGGWTSTVGWTDRSDGTVIAFGACAAGELRFESPTGKLIGQRIELDATETRFAGRGVELAGRLVLPSGTAKVPIAVLIHGSERTSARAVYALQRMLPAEGIGVFVYDKRGTGDSAGAYTQDFSVLADDAVAAVREAKRLAGARAGRIGFQGGSQGGWVAPLAASRAPVDFVVVSFGLAVSPIEEDQQEVELEMRLKGHAPGVIAKALEVTRAAEAVMMSGFTDGFARFDALRAKYRAEPWYKDLRGNMTRMLLPYSAAELRDKGQAYRFGTPWNYDSMPVLRKLRVPALWILGEDDLDAPSGETSRRLHALIAAGRPITLAMFPHAEHGMTEYEIKPADGERVSTRYAAGYFTLMRDFIRDGRIAGAYGASTITRPRATR
jgi:pimeloyl-ACP methyl ester carboxylesterase